MKRFKKVLNVMAFVASLTVVAILLTGSYLVPSLENTSSDEMVKRGSSPGTSTTRSRIKVTPIWSSRKHYLHSNVSEPSEKVEGLVYLPSKIVYGVKKFVFFVGYSRSGHSIIGTLMDAHPHVVIAHEFFLFKTFSRLNNRTLGMPWKNNLFNLLYQKSIADVSKIRANSRKGYALGVEGLWQGKFDKYIEVMGDKSGGMVTHQYLENKEEFKRNYRKLQKELSIPIRIIHAVRNPFDMIATNVALHHDRHKFIMSKDALNSTVSKREEKINYLQRPSQLSLLEREIPKRFMQFDAVVELLDIFGKENVLEVHNIDLVNDPKGTISRIFDFLGVETSTHYLDVSAKKVFKSVSRSRNFIEWTPELRDMVERRIKQYKMFSRYSFTSD